MFTGMQRHIDPCHTPDFMAPHAGTIDHHFARYMTRSAVFCLPINAGDPPAFALQSYGFHPLLYQRSVLAGAFGQRQRNIARVALSVLGQIDPRLHPIEIKMRIAGPDFTGCDFFYINTKSTRHRRLAKNLFTPLGRQRRSDRTNAFEPCGHAGLDLKRAVELL